MKRNIITILVIALIMLGFLPIQIHADGENWLTGYASRKRFTITGSPDGILSNYQLRLSVNRSTGTDSGLTVYVGSGCQSDYDDLRFTTSDGSTLLDYWVDSASTTSIGYIWVEFDTIAASPATTNFYMYYGAGTAAYSNGTNTFITFDNFERGSNGDGVGGSWTVTAGACNISTDHAYGGTRSVKLSGYVATGSKMTIPRSAGSGYAIKLRAWKEDATDNAFLLIHGNGTKRIICKANSTEDLIYSDGSDHDTGSNLTADNWTVSEISDINFTSYTYDWTVVSTQVSSNIPMETNTAYNNVAGLAVTDTTSGNDFYIDDFIIRSWTTNEPTITAWATAESANGNLSGVMHYQPIAIISGTTMPDRDTSDGSQDGVITWGTNPSGVTVVIGPFGEGVGGGHEAKAPPYSLGDPGDFITDPPAPAGNFSSSTIPSTWWGFDIWEDITNVTTTPVQFALLIVSGFIILVLSLTSSWIMRRFGSGSHSVKVGLIFGCMGVCVALGLYDWWMGLIFAVIAIALSWMSQQRGATN